MEDPSKMTPEMRFNATDAMARALFGTRWKTALAARYGLSRRTPQNWAEKKDAPVWIVVALRDAASSKFIH